ncbi:MAG: CvpA family protein [Deltaproteobacteria bacterium]|jgi:membrane protein required for colicin V production|nr:CvpA family protein [Deltaproteobacteria bacterium]
MSSLNYLDLLLGGLLLAFMLRGLLRGAVGEVVGLAGFVLGMGVAGNDKVHNFAMNHLGQILGTSADSSMTGLIAYAVAFAAPFLAVAIVGRLLQQLLNAAVPGFVSRLLGALVGLAKGMVVCTLILLVLQFAAPGSKVKSESLLVPYISSAWSKFSSLTDGAYKLPDFTRKINL